MTDHKVLIDFPQILENLNDLQNYLDDINEVLYEFEDFDDFDCYITYLLSSGADCPAAMWISECGFAVATIACLDDEFKVNGTLF